MTGGVGRCFTCCTCGPADPSGVCCCLSGESRREDDDDPGRSDADRSRQTSPHLWRPVQSAGTHTHTHTHTPQAEL